MPPVHFERPGIVLRLHVRPPSREEATRSLRVESGPTSCFQVPTMFRGFAGLTVIDGSTSWPVIMVASKAAPGHPAANGLGPETCRRSLTLYGAAAAMEGTAAITATAKTTRNRGRIATPPRTDQER